MLQFVCLKLPDRSNDNTLAETVLWASGGRREKNAWITPKISSMPPGVQEFPSRTRVSEVCVQGGRKGTEWLSLVGACLCLMKFSKIDFILILLVGLMLTLHCTDSSLKALHEISWIETDFKRGCRRASWILSLGVYIASVDIHFEWCFL